MVVNSLAAKGANIMGFDIPNAEVLPRDLSSIFQQIRDGRRFSAERVKQELRASSFPICPRAYHIFRRTPIDKRPLNEETFISDSATLMGTALHLALQRWFALQGTLYGNWVCVRCNKIRKHRTGFQTCSGCGNEMIYHEYSIVKSEGVPFSGHLDGILRCSDDAYIIDFKGSSQDAMRDIRNSGKPKESHYLQVNAYANAVNMNPEHYGGISGITKVIIIYVDRATPWRVWLPLKVPVSAKLYHETVMRIKLAFQSLEDMTVPRGLCLSPADPYAKYCSWKQVCFSPAIDGLLSDKVEPEGKARSHSDRDLLVLASRLDPGNKIVDS